MDISIIVAIGRNKEIGYRGHIPWKLPTDLKHFKSLPENPTVIMGKKTHKSIGKTLPNRSNIILTRNNEYHQEGCLVAHSFEAALKLIPANETEAFIIGGSEIYAIALQHAVKMYITKVDYSGPADTYFPEFNQREWQEISSEPHIKSGNDQFNYRFAVYNKILHQPIDEIT